MVVVGAIYGAVCSEISADEVISLGGGGCLGSTPAAVAEPVPARFCLGGEIDLVLAGIYCVAVLICGGDHQGIVTAGTHVVLEGEGHPSGVYRLGDVVGDGLDGGDIFVVCRFIKSIALAVCSVRTLNIVIEFKFHHIGMGTCVRLSHILPHKVSLIGDIKIIFSVLNHHLSTYEVIITAALPIGDIHSGGPGDVWGGDIDSNGGVIHRTKLIVACVIPLESNVVDGDGIVALHALYIATINDTIGRCEVHSHIVAPQGAIHLATGVIQLHLGADHIAVGGNISYIHRLWGDGEGSGLGDGGIVSTIGGVGLDDKGADYADLQHLLVQHAHTCATDDGVDGGGGNVIKQVGNIMKAVIDHLVIGTSGHHRLLELHSSPHLDGVVAHHVRDQIGIHGVVIPLGDCPCSCASDDSYSACVAILDGDAVSIEEVDIGAHDIVSAPVHNIISCDSGTFFHREAAQCIPHATR